MNTSDSQVPAVHAPALSGDVENVKALLEGNPDLVFRKDERGETPLHYAVFADGRDVVQLLLANKADVNAKDNNGQMPLHTAAAGGHKDVVELLRQHGGHEQPVQESAFD
jgi:ankyrin repeat protein